MHTRTRLTHGGAHTHVHTHKHIIVSSLKLFGDSIPHPRHRPLRLVMIMLFSTDAMLPSISVSFLFHFLLAFLALHSPSPVPNSFYLCSCPAFLSHFSSRCCLCLPYPLSPPHRNDYNDVELLVVDTWIITCIDLRRRLKQIQINNDSILV